MPEIEAPPLTNPKGKYLMAFSTSTDFVQA